MHESKANGRNRLFFNKKRQGQNDLHILRKRVVEMEGPERYALGIPRPALDIPTNIIVFSRNNERQLIGCLPHANFDQIVLIMNLEGAGTVMLDNKRICLRPGQALFMFPHQIHSYPEFEKSSIVWLFVSFQVERSNLLAQLRNAPAPVSPVAWKYVGELLDIYPKYNPEMPSSAAGIAIALWRLILELLSETCPAKPFDVPVAAEELVARIQKYITENIRGPIRIKDMARAFSISESKLCRDFKRFTHVSVGCYFRNWRVFYACRLMEASDDNLTQIAAQCGFASVYAFSRTFKHVMGLPPRDWRARRKMDRKRVADAP